MTKIARLYASIYEQLKKLQDELDAATQYDASRIQMDEALRQRRMENLKEQLQKIDDYMAKAEYFRLLSEKNLTSKNILTITPRELNFTRLRNWAMMMDPTQTDDPYAKRIYVQSCCNIMFLENKKVEFENTLSELENGTDHLQQDEEKKAAIEAEKLRLIEKFRSVLGGEEVSELANALALQDFLSAINERVGNMMALTQNCSSIMDGDEAEGKAIAKMCDVEKAYLEVAKEALRFAQTISQELQEYRDLKAQEASDGT